MKLSEDKLKELLPRFEVCVFDSIESTNTEAKSKDIYTLVAAAKQTAGRGRSGKSFFSPTGGIYMSVVMPNKNLATVRAAAAVSRCIEKASSDKAKIKWVNDIFSGGKKVAGILCEKTGDKIILGIGININRSDFPKELENIAGSVTTDCDREDLIAILVKELLLVWDLPSKILIKEYRDRLFILGKPVEYIKNGELHRGIAADINEYGNLIVSENGVLDVLNSGEISLGSDKF